MATITANPGAVLSLGREGENLARQIVFDIAQWQTEYGPGTVSLIAQRPGDPAPYPCAITVDGPTVIWPITSADTAVATKTPGVYAHCELQYRVDDVLVKSETWRTFVADALGEPSPEPPEPWQGWVDEVLEAAAQVQSAVVSPPKIGDNGNWWVWDADAGEYADTGAKASGDDIVYVNLDDYGMDVDGTGVNVPSDFVALMADALNNKKLVYASITLLGTAATLLLDVQMEAANDEIGQYLRFSGVGAAMLDGDVVTASGILIVLPHVSMAAFKATPIVGEQGPQGPQGPQGEPGPPGEDGVSGGDGISPTIKVSRGTNKTILTITDANGTTEAEIPDGQTGPAGADGKDGAPGKDNLPNVETLAGTEQSLELAHNVEYRCVDALTSLTVTGFGAPPAGKAALYSIQFTAGEGIAVTVPGTVIWAMAEPVFTAGCTYWLTMTELGDKYLAVWVEVANG
uniref:Nucleoid-associated protein n=1 Tax=Siphoviridae sp. ctwDU14 TaxID=2825726 RepID=A0A8S5PHR7_9CAUD|nr:MAG TPA: nucleoid-associated protein [Siphoviridae sp. ctwDU14]